MPLSASDIHHAFEALSGELGHDGNRAEIVIAGGAALVLLFGARETTKDVDAYFVAPEASVVREAAARTANRLDLPGDWLNDAAKGYFVGVTFGEVLHDSPSLLVRAASIAQLLAMKLAAWRDAIDRGDAKLLLSRMTGSADEIWRQVKPFVPPDRLNKASYAFEDLWEALYGAP
ncbi:MAG TPA: nucleotidyl transferase [Thermoanaerobaculia bacterium]|nr:nucleotidyl transferase [Thermoanaerobaculia bacterium]